jgi:hypothetical protein
MTRRLIALALLSALATPSHAEDTSQSFALEKFFVGDCVAEGHFVNSWTGQRRDLTVKMHGRWDGVFLTLKEDFAYSDGEKDTKTWVFTKVGDGRYTGTREDVVKDAVVTTSDDGVTMAYTAKLGGIDVDFHDSLKLIDAKTVQNHADVYFLGFIKLGDVDLTMTRKSR